jgi:hypothetical protein
MARILPVKRRSLNAAATSCTRDELVTGPASLAMTRSRGGWRRCRLLKPRWGSPSPRNALERCPVPHLPQAVRWPTRFLGLQNVLATFADNGAKGLPPMLSKKAERR